MMAYKITTLIKRVQLKEQRENGGLSSLGQQDVAGLVKRLFCWRNFSGISPFTNQNMSKTSRCRLFVPFPLGEDRKKLAGKVQCLDGPLQVMDFLKHCQTRWVMVYDA